LARDHEPKFRRILPDARREHLVEATLKCLAAHGHQGASVRRIAAEAGVSIGLINHHYASIDLLVANAYTVLSDRLVGAIRAVMAKAPPNPRAQLDAFLDASFSPTVLDPALLNVWIVFWSMIKFSPDIQAAQDRLYGEYQTIIATSLGALAAERQGKPVDVRLGAIGLTALLDGLWLEWCLNPKTFTPQEGIKLCQSWIDALVA
jgi:TetR/AcrR family transcriptional repressor of bet genes